MKYSSIGVNKQRTRKAYADRAAERRFVASVMGRKMTPEIEQRMKEGADRAQAAMEAPFLAKFRQTGAAIAA